jgi:hypothetical protein
VKFLINLFFTLLLFQTYASGYSIERIRVRCDNRETFVDAIRHLDSFGLGDRDFDYVSKQSFNKTLFLESFFNTTIEDYYSQRIAEDVLEIYDDLHIAINRYYSARGAFSSYELSATTCGGEKGIYANSFQESYHEALESLENLFEDTRILFLDSKSLLIRDYLEAHSLGLNNSYWIVSKLEETLNQKEGDVFFSLSKMDSTAGNLTEFNTLFGIEKSIHLRTITLLHSEYLKTKEARNITNILERMTLLLSQVSEEEDLIKKLEFDVLNYTDSDIIERLFKEYRKASYVTFYTMSNFDSEVEKNIKEELYYQINTHVESLNKSIQKYISYKEGLGERIENYTSYLATSFHQVNRSIGKNVVSKRTLEEGVRFLQKSETVNDVFTKNYFLEKANETLETINLSIRDPDLFVFRRIYDLEKNYSIHFEKLPLELRDLVVRKMLEDERFEREINRRLIDEDRLIGLYGNISLLVFLSEDNSEINQTLNDLKDVSIYFEDVFSERRLTARNYDVFINFNVSFENIEKKFQLVKSYICQNISRILSIKPFVESVYLSKKEKVPFKISRTALGRFCLDNFNSPKNLTDTSTYILLESFDVLNVSTGNSESILLGENILINTNYTIYSDFDFGEVVFEVGVDYCPLNADLFMSDVHIKGESSCGKENKIRVVVRDIRKGENVLELFYEVSGILVEYSSFDSEKLYIKIMNKTKFAIEGKLKLDLPLIEYVSYAKDALDLDIPRTYFIEYNISDISHLFHDYQEMDEYYKLLSYAHNRYMKNKLSVLLTWLSGDYSARQLTPLIANANQKIYLSNDTKLSDIKRLNYLLESENLFRQLEETIDLDRKKVELILKEDDFFNTISTLMATKGVVYSRMSTANFKHDSAISNIDINEFDLALEKMKDSRRILREGIDDLRELSRIYREQILDKEFKVLNMSLGLSLKRDISDVKNHESVSSLDEREIFEYVVLRDMAQEVVFEANYLENMRDILSEEISRNFSILRSSLNLDLIILSEKLERIDEGMDMSFSSDEKKLLKILEKDNVSKLIPDSEPLIGKFQEMPTSTNELELNNKITRLKELIDLEKDVREADKSCSYFLEVLEDHINVTLLFSNDFIFLSSRTGNRWLYSTLKELETNTFKSIDEGKYGRAFVFSENIFYYTPELAHAMEPRLNIGFILVILLIAIGVVYKRKELAVRITKFYHSKSVRSIRRKASPILRKILFDVGLLQSRSLSRKKSGSKRRRK